MITKTALPSNRQQTSRASRDTDTSRLFSTKNDIPADARSRIAELLNRRLADCIDLQTQCKQAHWNVKGPSFIGLHKLFDDINTDVEEYVDLLAERVVQLGGVAEGTARCVAERRCENTRWKSVVARTTWTPCPPRSPHSDGVAGKESTSWTSWETQMAPIS